jgi:16S rRNA processing protein RimM
MNTEDTLEIGVVVKPHGIRGELKVKLHFEGSDSLTAADSVLLRHADGRVTSHAVESARSAGKAVLLMLEGVASMNAAEALREAVVLVKRSSLPALEEGEYYLVDLVGCEVFLAGACLGRVRAVRPDPSVDTMVIETPSGETVEQPIGDAWVGAVDVAARRVELINDDGLIR